MIIVENRLLPLCVTLGIQQYYLPVNQFVKSHILWETQLPKPGVWFHGASLLWLSVAANKLWHHIQGCISPDGMWSRHLILGTVPLLPAVPWRSPQFSWCLMISCTFSLVLMPADLYNAFRVAVPLGSDSMHNCSFVNTILVPDTSCWVTGP